jgi:hypothetical protein
MLEVTHDALRGFLLAFHVHNMGMLQRILRWFFRINN